MKKLSVLLVALAVAVSASAGVSLKAQRTVRSNKVINTEMTKFKVSDLKSKADFKVINTQPEGELKSYLRSGEAIYASGSSIYYGEQSNGRMDIVFGENNVVYLKNILYNCGAFFGDNWVEGTINEEGTEITVPLGQSIFWSDSYQADVVLAWGSTAVAYDEEGNPYIEFIADTRTTEVVYTIDGETITGPQGVAPVEDEANEWWRFEATGLSCYWTDDNSFGGFMEWGTTFTETEPFVAPTVITEIPEGCEINLYYRTSGYIANSIFGIMNGMTDGKFQVAFANDGTVYIQNPSWWHDSYGSWVKGTFDPETNIITIPVGQYLTYNESYQYGIQLMWGYTEVVETVDEEGNPAYSLNYAIDERATEIQFMVDGDYLHLVGSYGDLNAEFPNDYVATGMMTVYSDDLSMTSLEFTNVEEPFGTIVNLVPAVPADPTADDWYDAGNENGYTRFDFTLPTTDVDGNPIDPEFISYSIFTDDDQIFTFDAATYDHDLTEDMTEIPYDIFNGGYDFGTNHVYFYRTNTGYNPLFQDRIGIQVFYTINGVKNASNIVYFEVVPPTPAVPANPTADSWSDCGDESGYSRFGFTLPTTDVDGNKIEQMFLSYSIYLDNDELFMFLADDYSDLPYNMTEIPYAIWSDGWDFYKGAVYFYRTNEGQNGEEPLFHHQIGIQVHYTVDDIKNSSDIVYLEVFPDTKVNEINAGKTVANVRYFNMAGQEMAQPQGMTIQVTTYTDGTSSAAKVVK